MPKTNKEWEGCIIGITGASGSLGKALTKSLRKQGAYVIGLTHKKTLKSIDNLATNPQEWVHWNCGKEFLLEETLSKLDFLILNHGINPQGSQETESIDNAIEINALSTWRLVKLFEKIVLLQTENKSRKEIWVNTSEAEVQPTLSPGYEISKRLIGELTSLMWNNMNKDQRKKLQIKKLILGPFKSELNPIGILSSEFVANQILNQSKLNLPVIIVTPNPITYLTVPIIEIIRNIYSKIVRMNSI